MFRSIISKCAGRLLRNGCILARARPQQASGAGSTLRKAAMIDKLLFTLPGMKAALARAAVIAAVMGFAVIGLALSLARALSSMWAGEPAADQVLLVAAAAGCLVLRAAASYAQRFFIERYARKTAADLRAGALSAAFEHGPAFVRGYGTAAVADAVIEGADRVESYLRIIVPKMAAIVIVPIILLAFAFPIDWVTGLIALVAFPFIILYMVMLGSTAKAEAAKRYEQFQKMANHFLDSIRGIATLKLFGASARREASIYESSEAFREATMKTLRIATLSSAVLDAFATFSLAAVAIMLGFRLVDGTIALEPALIVLVVVPEYFRPVREFASDYHASLDGKTALAKILDVVRAPKAPTHADDIAPWSETSRLVLSNASLSHDGVAALSDVSFSAKGFARIGVVGPSGAGKSTLAGVIAGFVEPDACSACVDGHPVATLAQDAWRRQVIYIPQHPYLFHATLRENIAFFRPDAPEDDIVRAVDAAGLADVVAALPLGLDTVVGEGARDLSGGERQRVAIARALVDRSRRIIVFDEPTAHLDIETEYELKERMLPLMEGRLVVFATHRMHWMENMDTVVRLEGGRVVEVSAGGHAMVAEKHARGARALAEGHAGLRAAETAHAPTAQTAQPSTRRRAKTRDRWMRPYLSKYKRALAAAIALGIAFYAFAVSLMVTSGYLISASAAAETILALHIPLLLVRIFGIGKPVLGYLERLASHDWVLRMTSLMRRDLFRALDAESVASFAARRTGETLGLLSDDIGHLQNLYLRTVFPTVVAWVLYVIVTAAFGFLSPTMAGVLFCSLGLVAVVAPVASIVANGAREAYRSHLRKEAYADLTDNVLGLADWVYAQREADYERRFDGLLAEQASLSARADAFSRGMDFAVQAVLAFAFLAVTLWAGTRFGGSPADIASWIAAFSIGFFPLIDAFAPLPEAALGSLSHRESIARLNELPDPHALSAHKEDSKATPQSRQDEANGPNGAIEAATVSACEPAIAFHDVAYRYPGSEHPVIDKLSFEIPRGQKVAVLGRSGAGKSTLAWLMRGDLSPASGIVRIGGADPATFGEDAAHAVGMVQQTTYLFHATVLENLRIAKPDATEQEARAAIDAVGLTQRIEKLGEGLASPIDEAGENFSGGERHRIALARLYLLDPDIVILDEPCAGLDPDTENDIIETLFNVFADKTIVMITHHLAGAALCDRVVFLEDGAIARDGETLLDGAPDELARASKRYAKLLAFDR